MFELESLSASYGLHRALDRVSLRVGDTEVVVMLGANGAGKTTMLKAIAGLLPTPSETRMTLAGQPLHALPARLRVEAGIALVPEGRGIFGELTVLENLSLGAYPQRARAAEKANLERVLSLFPRLAERLKQTARTMSGGEQQMVAVGRALMSAPRLLLLDEPSLGLSPLVCSELFRALEHVKGTGVSILLVEQNAKRSLAIADRGYLLENGRIVGEGAAQQLLNDPAVQSAYLGMSSAAA
ncbi:MAG TPA: ABC transporter ATP-binding protein [Rubrivivax sp.]|nr:ABC transporter ATP-binding protein [Rubrivivax sp.]